MKVKSFIFFIAVFASINLRSQILIPASGTVSENFNAMTAGSLLSLPAGWKVSGAGLGASANWNDAGNAVTLTQSASSGSPITGGSYNWGTTAGTDRAVGFMTSGSYSSPNAVLAFYRNTTGATITF